MSDCTSVPRAAFPTTTRSQDLGTVVLTRGGAVTSLILGAEETTNGTESDGGDSGSTQELGATGVKRDGWVKLAAANGWWGQAHPRLRVLEGGVRASSNCPVL